MGPALLLGSKEGLINSGFSQPPLKTLENRVASSHNQELIRVSLSRDFAPAQISTPLEPISKLFQEHRDAGELHKPEEVGRVILPTNQ